MKNIQSKSVWSDGPYPSYNIYNNATCLENNSSYVFSFWNIVGTLGGFYYELRVDGNVIKHVTNTLFFPSIETLLVIAAMMSVLLVFVILSQSNANMTSLRVKIAEPSALPPLLHCAVLLWMKKLQAH